MTARMLHRRFILSSLLPLLTAAFLPLVCFAQTPTTAPGPKFSFTPAPQGIQPIPTPIPAPFAFAPQPIPTNAPPFSAPLTWSPIVPPTNAPIKTPTNAPVVSPTNFPVVSPTNFPVVSSTNAPVVAPTNTPVVAPTNVPIRAPTTAPVIAPTDFPILLPTTVPPTRMPAIMPVTDLPTVVPTKTPSLAPLTAAPSTMGPTISPSQGPVDSLSYVYRTENVPHVTMTFSGVGKLDFNAEEVYSEEVSPWFDAYFAKNRRRLQEDFGIRNMISSIDFSNQEVTEDGNTVTFTHNLSYDANGSAPSPDEIVKLPFNDDSYREQLVPILRNEVPGFDTWDGVVNKPRIVPPRGPENPVKEETFFSPAIISGIAGGGVALCGLFGALLFCCIKRRLKRKNYGRAEEQPPDHFQFSNSVEDGISVMDEPLTKPNTSNDVASLGYGDQSVATVDYDYSKAYGGGAASVVSSVGGTLGDTTRLTAENVGSTRAALGANVQDVRQQGGVHEEVIVIEAPPGKLGVVIDTPDDGAPLVHAVKDSSVIADQICVGDKLVAVDDDDVRSMTAIKVSKLISRRSANPSRRLTVVRTIHAGQ